MHVFNSSGKYSDRECCGKPLGGQEILSLYSCLMIADANMQANYQAAMPQVAIFVTFREIFLPSALSIFISEWRELDFHSVF